MFCIQIANCHFSFYELRSFLKIDVKVMQDDLKILENKNIKRTRNLRHNFRFCVSILDYLLAYELIF